MFGLFNDKTVAFTGHRQYENKDWVAQELQTAILVAIEKGFDTFISGMAQGVDQLVVKILIEAKKTHPGIRIVAAKPFLEHGHGIIEYNEMLGWCNYVVVTGEYVDRRKYYIRDKWMVDHATKVVAVLDSRPVGGTLWTVDYALTKHKPVYRINPETKTATIM